MRLIGEDEIEEPDEGLDKKPAEGHCEGRIEVRNRGALQLGFRCQIIANRRDT